MHYSNMTTYHKERPLHLRTTTYRDYLNTTYFEQKPAELRPLSPTRRTNPHPGGLRIQRPYNKYDNVNLTAFYRL